MPGIYVFSLSSTWAAYRAHHIVFLCLKIQGQKNPLSGSEGQHAIILRASFPMARRNAGSSMAVPLAVLPTQPASTFSSEPG